MVSIETDETEAEFNQIGLAVLALVMLRKAISANTIEWSKAMMARLRLVRMA